MSTDILYAEDRLFFQSNTLLTYYGSTQQISQLFPKIKLF